MAHRHRLRAGYTGGWRPIFDGPNRDWRVDSVNLGPTEAVWRLVVNKVEVQGRFVLRSGEFVELAEGVE
jgi:hypothetical protein